MTFPIGVTFKINNTDMSNEPDLKLVHSTETPGGFRDCTFTLCRSGLVELLDKVTIYDSVYNKYPFIGLVNSIRKRGSAYDVTATRSTKLQVFRSSTIPQDITHPSGTIAGKVYQPGTPMSQALTDALQLCEDVFAGTIATVSQQFVTPSSNLGGNTAEQVWNYVASLLNNLVLLWHVRGANGLQVVDIEYLDLAGRYFVEVPEDRIEELFSVDAIINRVAISWGHDQVYIEPPLVANISYAAIKKIHDRYVGAGSAVTRLGDAQGIAGAYMSKFGQYRSVDDNITLRCATETVRVVPPLVLSPNDNWPLHLIESGHGIVLLNRPVGSIGLKYITGTRYDWTTGELQISCGEPIDLGTNIEAAVDYDVNRLYNGPASSAPPRWQNHPIADISLLATFGPEMPGDTPPSNMPGIPTFVRNDGAPDSTQTPYTRVIHPGDIADEGIEINYSFDIASVGWKGGTWSIPSTLKKIKYSLWKSSATNGLQIDSCSINVYTRVVGSNPVFLTSLAITGVSEGIINVTPHVLPGRDVQLVFNVIVAANLAEIINVTLHADKHYPGLKI